MCALHITRSRNESGVRGGLSQVMEVGVDEQVVVIVVVVVVKIAVVPYVTVENENKE